MKFIASGSAAAALKMKSTESGAGRFTDFMLPPLTFHEYIHLLGLNALIVPSKREWKGQEIYRYDLSHKTLTYTDLTTNNQITLTNVMNLIADIQRRQVNMLISIVQQIGMTIQFTKGDLKKSSISLSSSGL